MIIQSKLLPVGPMARRLRVAVKWLREEAASGRIPHLEAGRTVLFDPDTVERVLLERAQCMTGPALPVPKKCSS
jgi:hypothetical protein